jgi:hypothetical protein
MSVVTARRQAIRADGTGRWWIYTSGQPEGDTGSPRKTVWTRTAEEARSIGERLGYTVTRVEPAPPASLR